MRLRIILVGLFLALMFLHFGVQSYHDVSLSLKSSSAGWSLSPVNGRVRLAHGLSAADTSLLRDDDEIIALNGQKMTNEVQLSITRDKTFAQLPPGGSYTLVVRRTGELQPLTLRTARRPLWPKIAEIMTWLLAVVFPLTGLVVFLVKPNNKQALLLALMLATCWQSGPSPGQLMTVIFFGHPSWLVAALILALVIGRGFGPIFFHFFLVFPQPSPLLNRFPRFEFYLYLPYLLLGI